ncbi:MAG: hypothetical protein WCB94_16080 [Terriglobales bacterium]
MKRITFFALVVVMIGLAQAQDSLTPAQGWTKQAVTPDDAQAFLEATLHGEKHVAITGLIADTNKRDVDLGTHCSSSSSGTVNGTVDDSGTVTGNVHTSGDTHCRDVHNYFYRISVVYSDKSNSSYIIAAQCDERWVWNHCALPVIGDKDEMVITREKKGHYAVHILLRRGALDRKGTSSIYEIVDLQHFTKQ